MPARKEEERGMLLVFFLSRLTYPQVRRQAVDAAAAMAVPVSLAAGEKQNRHCCVCIMID